MGFGSGLACQFDWGGGSVGQVSGLGLFSPSGRAVGRSVGRALVAGRSFCLGWALGTLFGLCWVRFGSVLALFSVSPVLALLWGSLFGSVLASLLGLGWWGPLCSGAFLYGGCLQDSNAGGIVVLISIHVPQLAGASNRRSAARSSRGIEKKK